MHAPLRKFSQIAHLWNPSCIRLLFTPPHYLSKDFHTGSRSLVARRSHGTADFGNRCISSRLSSMGSPYRRIRQIPKLPRRTPRSSTRTHSVSGSLNQQITRLNGTNGNNVLLNGFSQFHATSHNEMPKYLLLRHIP